MSLTKEWYNRITHWDNALWQICYEPLALLELDGFVTKDHLTAEEASKHNFHRMPIGTAWGKKWEYGWFKCDITLPEKASGRRIVMRLNPAAKPFEDGEVLVWSNNQVIGSFGWARKEITLTRNGIPGDTFAILAEAYAGHGPMVMGGGPNLYGHDSVPEPKGPQVVVGESSFGIWREQAYQLALDFTTLFELRNRLEQTSLRVSEIDAGLKEVTLIMDLELPEPEMLETINQARECLQPLLACVNGTTAPTFYAFGHAHLDIAWLWPLAETERKFARTVINQLSIMEEYPEYRFLQSQPFLYSRLKNFYPELYERFKQAVLAGKVIPDGAMWIEADTNLTGGESLIRQIVLAKQFCREEFNLNMEVMWLPDAFGYSGALPQILLGCGCIGFATQKIAWTYHGGDPFPYNTFLWEGIDGSTIPAHIFTDYNSHTRPGSLLDRWESRLQKDGISTMLLAFGWGDGGGGPSRDHLEFLERARDLEGLPRVKQSSPHEFFRDLQQKGLPKERYVGELYFQAHRGTYTSQAKTKQANRKSEIALREAEFWGSLARMLSGYDFSPESLRSAWKKILVNQFHDVLPGSSIQRVYEEAGKAYAEVIGEATQKARGAAASLLTTDDKLTIFNSLAWERTILLDINGDPIEVTVPSCGMISISKSVSLANQKKTKSPGVTATPLSLENELLRASFNQHGELVSLVDKETDLDMIAGVSNRFCLYKDIPARFDAWDIDSMTEELQMPTEEHAQMELLSSNPLIGKIKLTRKIHHSAITQIISLRKNSRRIEFDTMIDWQESHKLLKAEFEVNIHSNEAIHEIQFGHLRRPNHRSRPFDADRFEVCNHKWSAFAEENRGVAILNDSKYGINVLGNSMKLTLLKSALAPDPTADKGLQKFTYALYYWNGSFAECNVVREAYELNYPVMTLPGSARKSSYFSLNADNIVLETVKPAEDGTDDIILRLYEAKRTTTKCVFTTTLPVRRVTQTDMLERFLVELPFSRGKVNLIFRPFEVKTLRLMVNK